MSTNVVRDNNGTGPKLDLNLEIVVIPVSNIDRAKEFYARLGWRLDADYDNGNDFRVIKFTPPGSACSVIFGKNITAATPGSAQGLYLIVSDIQGCARRTRRTRCRGEPSVPRRRRRVCWDGPAVPVWARSSQRSGSRTSQLPLVCLLQRSRRQWLAAAGDQGAASGPWWKD
jgi:catechol 2,3-dioxygenase-like lactoylglutathione lyase family enzyme